MTYIAEFLQNYRKEYNLTLRELGETVGLSYSYLNKIERGESQPSKESIIIIANKLNLSSYKMLIQCGYTVDLEKDISIIDLNWSRNKLIGELIRYRIVALVSFRNYIYHSKIILSHLTNLTRIKESLLLEMISGREYLSYEQARNICFALNLKFYEIFQIQKVNNDIRFLGMKKEDEVAYQVFKQIELEKEEYYEKIGIVTFSQSKEEIATTIQTEELGESRLPYLDEIQKEAVKEVVEKYEGSGFERRKNKLLEEIQTIDELEYLFETLAAYKKIKDTYWIE